MKWTTKEEGGDDSQQQNKFRYTKLSGEWIELERVGTLENIFHVLRATFPIQPHTPKIRCPSHCSYLNRFAVSIGTSQDEGEVDFKGNLNGGKLIEEEESQK